MIALLKQYYFVFITLTLCLLVFAIDYKLRSNVEKNNEQIFRLEQLRNQIVYYDEALTMTARVAALTNNPALEERYTDFAVKLDSALLELKQFADDEKTRSDAVETDAANQQLIEIEEGAFALIKKGDSEAATKSLFSENYERQKEIYANGMKHLDASVQLKLSDLNQDIRSYNYIKTYSLVLTIVFLLFIAVFAVRSKNSLKERELSLSAAVLQAQASEMAKAQFLAKMSHEIRTPLNGIYGLVQVFEKKNLGQQQLEFMELIKISCNNLMAVINDVLDFSALESGKMKLVKEPFNLELELKNLIATYSQMAQEKGLKLELDLSPNCPKNLLGDYAKIRQVLTNLIGNAIKFTEQGNVQLIVTHTQKADGIELVFEVSDTGIGIPTESLPYIFESFVQADNTSSRRHGGSGLGLAISQQMVNLMGGKIAVTSKAGEGSCFKLQLTLPYA